MYADGIDATKLDAANLDAAVRAQSDATLGGLVRDGRSSYAAAVFVQNGRVAFSTAYGAEGPGSAPAFSIDATYFDLNSIRKIFTATAIAQLIDRGMIASIDDPVNRYLKHFKLPPAFGREVTLRALATHSAGLDETAFGAGSLDADPAQYLSQRFPGYFENAGLYSSYDGYGPKLLAYVVTEVTGKPYPTYIEESILRPLGMNDTFLAAPAAPLAHRVISFQPKSPLNQEVSPPLKPARAAILEGVAVSTMSDMAKFLIALAGPSAGQSVITQPMRDLMFRILQSNGEFGSAHGLLFDALRADGKTLFVHGGVGPGTRCMMALDETWVAGIFYCYGDVRTRFDGDTPLPPAFEHITDEMLKPFIACADAAANCTRYPALGWHSAWQEYLGLYVGYARHHHGFSQLRTLVHPTALRVERGADSLRVDGKEGFVEIAPGVFGTAGDLETFSFLHDPTTHKIILSVSDRPSVYERPGWLEDPRFLPRLLAVLVAIALSGALLVVLPGYAPSTRVRLAVAAYTAVVACGVAALFGLSAFGNRYFAGVAWPLDIVRVCAFLTVPAAAALLLVSIKCGAKPANSAGARLGRWHLYAIRVTAVLMVWSLLMVGLISFAPII